jgi:thermitase
MHTIFATQGGVMKRSSIFARGTALVTMIAGIQVGQTAFAKEYIVKMRSNYQISSFKVNSMQILDHHADGNLLKVNIPENKTGRVLFEMASHPNVEYVVPNAKMNSYLRSSDAVGIEALRTQWAITKVQAEKAWQRAGNKGSRKVVVAVIDTGADYRHPALSQNMVQGYDFADSDNDPMDITGSQNPGHGTHCSGIVGASGLIDGGTQGLSPEVSIMPLRFLDQNGSGDLMNGIKAIDYAISKHVDVISASWGARISRAEAKPLIEAVERAGKAGIPFVVAAANDGANNDTADFYPTNAGTDNTISVAATGSSDGRASVSVSAPGEGIVSTLPGSKYGDLSGTSMATPLVAGLVALVKAQNPNMNPLEIRSLLQASGDKIGIQVACNCRVNAFTAVDMVMSKTMFVSPNAMTIPVGQSRQFAGVFGSAPFSYSTSNPAIATIDSQGVMTPVSVGEVMVTVKDSSGKSATSSQIFVAKGSGGGGGTPPEPTDCPFANPKVCEIICSISPSQPYCSK